MTSSAVHSLARLTALLGLVTLAGACGGKGEAAATERLWISTVPTSPKQPITAFLATRTGDGKYIGAFFRGSLYRGGHDVFTWTDRKGGAELKFMQDGSGARLRFEACTPSKGFDHCLLVEGDPTGTRRYQSRKRWTVRRGKNMVPSQMIPQALADLAEDDEDLHQYLVGAP